MQDAASLFEEVIDWLRLHYGDYRFYIERDLVWTIRERLRTEIVQRALPYRIFHHYPIGSGYQGRGANSDIALVGSEGTIALAAEFKFEPSHARNDILGTKFPVVFWAHDGVGDDVARVQRFVAEGFVEVAYAVFVDEGRYFRHRPAHPGSSWVDWEPATLGAVAPAILWTRACKSDEPTVGVR